MLVAHLSDLHLGKSSPGDPHGAERLTSLRQAIVKLCALEPQAFVIAGDTFDRSDIEPAIIAQAVQILETAKNARGEPIPVVLIPGNHDPAEEEKLWGLFRKSQTSASVCVALEPQLISLNDGKLLIEAYPCPTRYSPVCPWERRVSTSPRAAGAVRVVVAHGTLQGGPVPEDETDAYPFTEFDLEKLGANYVALGHFHSVYPAWHTDDMLRPFSYSGTHEPDHFGGDHGYAILAHLNPDQPARLERMRVGRRQWRLLDIAVTGDLVRLEELRQEVAAAQQPGHFVVRFNIGPRAYLPREQVAHLERAETGLRALGAHVERRGEAQVRLDGRTLDLSALPSGAIKEALLSLQHEMSEKADAGRHELLAAALQIGWEQMQADVVQSR